MVLVLQYLCYECGDEDPLVEDEKHHVANDALQKDHLRYKREPNIQCLAKVPEGMQCY